MPPHGRRRSPPRELLGFEADGRPARGPAPASSTGGGRARQRRQPQGGRRDLPIMQPWLGEEEAAAAAEAVASGWVAQGPRVAAFEEAFADRVGAPHAVAVSNCTTGAAPRARRCSASAPGDEVIVPSLSFIATANAVALRRRDARLRRRRPGDRQPRRPATDRARRSPSAPGRSWWCTRAGVPADMDAIARAVRPPRASRWSRTPPAPSGPLPGPPVGSAPPLAVLLVPSPQAHHHRRGRHAHRPPTRALAARARRLREHGMSVSAAERHQQPAARHRAATRDRLQLPDDRHPGRLGLVQLGRLDAIVARRRELAARYHARLAGVPDLRWSPIRPGAPRNYQSFWVLLATAVPHWASQRADGASSPRPRHRPPGGASWPPTSSRRTSPTSPRVGSPTRRG